MSVVPHRKRTLSADFTIHDQRPDQSGDRVQSFAVIDLAVYPIGQSLSLFQAIKPTLDISDSA